MKRFYKVKITKFDKFIEKTMNEYESMNFKMVSNEILSPEFNRYLRNMANLNKYLYICVDDDYYLYSRNFYNISILICTKNNNDWLIENNWIYRGEYDGRKDKLNNLNRINKQI